MTRETRTIAEAELRLASAQTGAFAGYASIFGDPDAYGDTVKPGAFAKTLAERKTNGGPAMFWNHDPDHPIGVWTRLEEDARGLKVEGRLVTETVKGAEALALLKAGAVSGLSIGFRTRSSERGPNGGRVLTGIDLLEISLVSLPAAAKARVTQIKGAGANASVAAFVQAVRRAALAIKETHP